MEHSRLATRKPEDECSATPSTAPKIGFIYISIKFTRLSVTVSVAG